MTDRNVNGEQLASMFRKGAAVLASNVKKVDALNVFPVPDGDTGTNMNLTITSGVREVDQKAQNHAGNVAKAFSKGLLMGARGNSGVILSQLFRGFSRSVEKKETLTADDLKEALREGVGTAYKAVMKPVEGTILTVAKDAAEADTDSTGSITPAEWMESVFHSAEASLQTTPDLLPVLKEVGVVDSGGQGLLHIYEGMLQSLLGKTSRHDTQASPSMDELVKVEHHQNAQSHLSTDEIEYGYCTELMVRLDKEKAPAGSFDENAFKHEMARWGDSLLVVSDDDIVKVHIHAEYPGEVLSKAQRHGSLIHVKIDNMREQHEALTGPEETGPQSEKREDAPDSPPSPYGFVTIAAGKGVEDLFRGLGVQEVVAGGQTMNPSTEDIVNAVKKVDADTIFILPNNGNIVMSAEQAANVCGGRVYVISSKTVPQGLSAMFAFSEEESPEGNKEMMEQACSEVRSGQVTYAVRETKMGGLEINKGDFMGIAEKEIAAAGPELETVTLDLLNTLLHEEAEIVTLIRGEDGKETVDAAVCSYMEENYPDVELEIHDGGQPLYSYILAVE
ncbi:DAK2 domain-containing protein [Salibacterium sp. K-3]